jgi:hypothetical protein
MATMQQMIPLTVRNLAFFVIVSASGDALIAFPLCE